MDRGSERNEQQIPSRVADSRLDTQARTGRQNPAPATRNTVQSDSQRRPETRGPRSGEVMRGSANGLEHPNSGRHRQRTRSGRRAYNVSPAERETLGEIGRFRVIRLDDLALYPYSGRARELAQDLRNLTRQGLLQKKTVWTGRHREKVTFVALTKAGKSLLKRSGEGLPQQALYAGFVKPAELRHDAAIYPMFQKEAARIISEGGHVRRIVLDYELKKKAYSPLAKARSLPPAEYAKRQAEIAQAHGLKVVNGHIALPDLRIEYVTREGSAASVDLELATESYHGSHAAEKAGAGFRIYAAADTAARLSAALEEREITAEILSL